MYCEKITYTTVHRVEYEAQVYAKYEKEEGVSFCPYSFDGYGARYTDEPECTFERIIDAFQDYRKSQRWD